MDDVAIMGGSFNPIGLHHERMARLIKWHLHMPVWLMPCYDHQFEKDSELIDHVHRWNMVTEAVSGAGDWLVPCDWEIAHRHNGSMYDTMEQLVAAHPNIYFHIVIGMDNAAVISQWDRGLQLIKMFPFVVFWRPPISAPLWCYRSPHKVLSFDRPISSTKIRQAIREGDYDFAKRHLNPRVWDYIRTGKLYQGD